MSKQPSLCLDCIESDRIRNKELKRKKEKKIKTQPSTTKQLSARAVTWYYLNNRKNFCWGLCWGGAWRGLKSQIVLILQTLD